MPKMRAIGGALAAAGMMMSTQVHAQSEIAAEPVLATPVSSAKNIRNLNIMLMVTSLRCRGSAHDFSGEYELFAQAHQANIAQAHRELMREMSATYGPAGSERALDRDGVSIANSFGEGHPTMGCSDLKQAAVELAMSQDRVRLATMAARLLRGDAGAPTSKGRATVATPQDEVTAPARPMPNWLRG